MKTRASLKNRQGGAVAVMVGASIFLLVGFLAMVIDLGHLYIAKTELQNAADAAALSGAKQLNGSLLGVNDTSTNNGAVQWAIAAAAKNGYDFSSTPVDITIADIWVGNCPDDGCMVAASTITTDAAAANKTFIKVHTRKRDLTAWFAPIWNIFHVSTFGMAVAGRYTLQVTPMGVCAVDKTRSELGFLRGVAYNLPDLNPLNNGDPIWINPIDKVPGPCEQNNTSVPKMAPYVCTGLSTTITTLPGSVWVDTGNKAALDDPLNSRFGDLTSYTGGHACDPVSAPADTNVKEFTCTQVNGVSPNSHNCIRPNILPPNSPRDWIDTTPNSDIPTRQSISVLLSKPFNYPIRLNPEIAANFTQYGVLWSFSKEIKNFTTTPYTEYGTADWPTLYGGDTQNYPATSPYLQFVEPPTGPGATNKTAERRVLNLAIIDCAAIPPIAGQVCRQTLPVLAVGRFFMQRKADIPGRLFGEFAGILAPPLPPANIRLYR